MKIQTFASGSSGNCHLLSADNKKILLDAGISFHKIQKLMKGALPDAVLITHEHQDHANPATINQLVDRGIRICMTEGTAAELDLNPLDVNIIEGGYNIFIDDKIQIFAFDVFHDAAEPVNFIVSDATDTVLYLTDCGEIPPLRWDSYNVNKLLIEANYLPERLYNSDIDNYQRERIANNHLSIDQALDFIKGRTFDEIHLIHVSKRHGDIDGFKMLVSEVSKAKLWR